MFYEGNEEWKDGLDDCLELILHWLLECLFPEFQWVWGDDFNSWGLLAHDQLVEEEIFELVFSQ